MLQTVLDLVPDGGIAKRLLYNLIQLATTLDAVGAWAKGDVVVDAHGKRIGCWKTMPTRLRRSVVGMAR